MMTRSRPRVKPTRISPRPSVRFGEGLLPPSCPGHRAPALLSDLEWYARIDSIYGDDAWDEETNFEVRAEESRALDLIERGLIPDDLATSIERTSLVGHRP